MGKVIQAQVNFPEAKAQPGSKGLEVCFLIFFLLLLFKLNQVLDNLNLLGRNNIMVEQKVFECKLTKSHINYATYPREGLLIKYLYSGL